MIVTKDGPQRNIVFRSMRAAFRKIAPDSLIANQRDFRDKLAARGLKYVLKLRVDAYVGKYRCSVCARRVSTFAPLDADCLSALFAAGWKYPASAAETCNSDNYSCPHCGATDRDRLYALYCTRYFPTLTPSDTVKIVDFAPSPSLSAFIRKLAGRMPYPVSYVTADLFRSDVDDKVDIMEMNIYPEGSVDFFICSHVLEHVEDDRKAMSELYRILRQGGQGILVVPIILTIDEIDEDPSVTDEAERWRRFGQFDHVRLYSKPGFLARVGEAGFTITQLGSEDFGKETFREHAISEQSVLYVVKKP
jgi:SAM-dependent methyltransferase